MTLVTAVPTLDTLPLGHEYHEDLSLLDPPFASLFSAP